MLKRYSLYWAVLFVGVWTSLRRSKCGINNCIFGDGNENLLSLTLLFEFRPFEFFRSRREVRKRCFECFYLILHLKYHKKKYTAKYILDSFCEKSYIDVVSAVLNLIIYITSILTQFLKHFPHVSYIFKKQTQPNCIYVSLFHCFRLSF